MSENPWRSISVTSYGNGCLVAIVGGQIREPFYVHTLSDAQRHLPQVGSFFNIIVTEVFTALLLGKINPGSPMENAIYAVGQAEKTEDIASWEQQSDQYFVELLSKVLLWMANNAGTYQINLDVPEGGPLD